MQEVINWMISSDLNNYINAHSWIWPTLESLHFIGLCMLFGSLLLVDLKIMGFASEISFKAVEKFIIITLFGFAINIITGIAFIFGDPERYFVNPSFQFKMILILIAIANALYLPLRLRIYNKSNTKINNTYLPLDIKVVAAFSLLLWTGVIILGRFIPYVE